MADLAAKMAAGPPKKPVGLVKKPAKTYEDSLKENKEADSAQATTGANKKLADLLKQNPVSTDKDNKGQREEHTKS